MPSDLISVVLPVRNGDRYLMPAIESILAQDWPSFELVIVDDGSTDGTAENLKKISAPNVRVLTCAQIGLVAALNKGIESSRGSLVARMDADDLSLPTRLRRQADVFRSGENVDVLFTDAIYIDEHDNITGSESNRGLTEERIRRGALQFQRPCVLVHPSVMFKKSAWKSVEGYRDYVAAEDADFWLRLSVTHRIRQLEAPLLKYRRLPNSVSRTRRREQMAGGILSAVNFEVSRRTGIDLYRDRKEEWTACRDRLLLALNPILETELRRKDLISAMRARAWGRMAPAVLRLVAAAGNLTWIHEMKRRAMRRMIAMQSALCMEKLSRGTG